MAAIGGDEGWISVAPRAGRDASGAGRERAGALLLLGVAAVCIAAASPARASDTTVRVSEARGGAQGRGESYAPAVSANGRFVAFNSTAANLVPGDGDRNTDVFVRDLATGDVRRVSVGRRGARAGASSFQPAILADGRFVTFHSEASNVVLGDTNGAPDVFVVDRRTGETRLVSRGPGSTLGDSGSSDAAISADGRLVAFTSLATDLVPGDTNSASDIFVRDLRTSQTRRVSLGRSGGQANGGSFDPAVSANAGVVAFESFAANLVPGDTNGRRDVFARTR